MMVADNTNLSTMGQFSLYILVLDYDDLRTYSLNRLRIVY